MKGPETDQFPCVCQRMLIWAIQPGKEGIEGGRACCNLYCPCILLRCSLNVDLGNPTAQNFRLRVAGNLGVMIQGASGCVLLSVCRQVEWFR
jgi:hypothetical protein